MTIDGMYKLTMTIPSPSGDGTFFDGYVDFDLKGNRDGTLTGIVSVPGGPGAPVPITKGYYTGSEFMKLIFNVGPGAWEIWARVAENGEVNGMVSIAGEGMPNKVKGKKVG